MSNAESARTSAEFWDRLYREGGTSGTGSVGRLAEFKAEVVARVCAERQVASVVELGCGDGRQVALLEGPSYIGLDVSPAAIEICRRRFPDGDRRRFAHYTPGGSLPGADLALSLDVIYHLLEDAVYESYMSDLFAIAGRYALIYSSDGDEPSEWDEVRHHAFSDWIARRQPHWQLVERIEQRYPYVEGDPATSWSEFFLYERAVR